MVLFNIVTKFINIDPGGTQMFVYIGGVNGAGKTTLIEKVVKIAKRQGIPVCDAGVDQILCDMAGVPSLKEWRNLPEEIRDELRPKMEAVIRDIDAQNPGTIRLRDVHFVFSRANGERGFRIVQPWERERLSGIAIVVANPMEILRRRLKDIAFRPERKCDIKHIAEEQSLELATAEKQSAKIDVPLKVVKNETIGVVEAGTELLNFCIGVATVK